MTATPELIKANDFIARVSKDISRAKKRVWVMSMIVNEDASTQPFFDELMRAAERGIDVKFAADTFTFMELSGRMGAGKAFVGRVRGVARLRRKLGQANIHFDWLGGYAYTFFTGRTHVKWVVIDDVVYSFGGINLYDLGLASADLFLRLQDTKLADRLVDEHLRIINANRREYSYRSHYFKTANGNVLIDGGFIGDSLIYDRACHLAEKSTRIICVSQYCPTGKLSKLLRERETELYFSSEDHASLMNRLVIWLGTRVSGLRSQYRRDRYIHAKYIIFYLSDGTRAAITGSHNFVKEGEYLGTKEIALETRSDVIIDLLEAYTRDEIA